MQASEEPESKTIHEIVQWVYPLIPVLSVCTFFHWFVIVDVWVQFKHLLLLKWYYAMNFAL